MKYVATVIALALSSVAAYFSVLGMKEIFPKYVTEIVILTVLLEAAKVTTAAYLHMHWNKIGLFIKSYLAIAAVTIAIITSLGVYGFLMKSHTEQLIAINNGAVKESAVGEINKTVLETRLSSLNQRIDLINKSTAKKVDIAKKTKDADVVGSNDEAKLKELQKEKESLVTQIAELETKQLDVDNKVKQEATVLQGVWFQVLCILIVLTFDPLALTLLMSVNDITEPMPVKVNKPRNKLVPANKKKKVKKSKKKNVKKKPLKKKMVVSRKANLIYIPEKYVSRKGRPRNGSVKLPIKKKR